MRVLVALGGNALLRRGEPAHSAVQERNVKTAAGVLASLADEHEVVLTHGNGPQLSSLELALRNALPDRDLVTVLTQVVVSAEDSAFGRLVASPEPSAIAEPRSLRILIDAGALVICAGSGIPIAPDETGAMRGVDAVIDKDLTAALLARRLEADLLLMLTDVDAVHLDWGMKKDRALRSVSLSDLRRMDFAAGSMGPKVEAACRFVEATGRRAAIGALRDAVEIARGGAGTQVAVHSV